MVLQHVIVAASIAIILAPFSYYSGHAARYFRLPQITGYLISGVVCGPYLLGLLSSDSLSDLNIVEGACLGIIGVAAGAELNLSELSRSRKQVIGLTLAICVFSWVFCYAALEWIGNFFPLLPFIGDRNHLVAIASLGATLMMARSPASAIAVLKEMDGRGPFSSLVMAVVVVKDVVVITAYALNIEAVRVMTHTGAATHRTGMLAAALPVLSVLLSATIGVCGSLLLSICLRPHGPWMSRLAGLTPVSMHRLSMLAVVFISTLVFQLAHVVEAEPLLACVVMGIIVANRISERGEKEREDLLSMLAQIMSFSNVAFFGLAGASLKLSALHDMFVPAVVVFIARIFGIYVGSWVGSSLTATTTEYKRLFWMSMVTQAGVAMGLARLAGTQFPDWGPHFQTFMISIVLLNLLVGPPLFKHTLVHVGEATAVTGSLPLKSSSSFKAERQPPAVDDEEETKYHGLAEQESRQA